MVKIKIKSRYTKGERVIIITPSIGEKGDMTDRSFVGDCDVDAILRKYGTVNYQRFTSADCADVSDLPSDLMELELMKANVLAAHKQYGSDIDINIWLASLFDKKDEKSVEEPNSVVNPEPESVVNPEPESVVNPEPVVNK